MKHILTLIAAALTLSAGKALAQANSQGNFIIDAYYGGPNLGKSFWKSIENDVTVHNYEASGVGPAGIRAEYMLSDNIGIGLDMIYNSNQITYTKTDSVYDGGSASYSMREVGYRHTMDRLRVQARFNFHFEVSNPALDAYFGVGAGTNTRFRHFYREGNEEADDFKLGTSLTLIPVSLRICTGFRYYFTPNIGVNAEIGLGGPLLSAGASVRF